VGRRDESSCDNRYVARVKLRLTLAAATCLLIAVGAFVWLHSGTPGDAACEGSRFVPSSGFSAWPPGARCTYGLPARTDVVVNGWFAAVVGMLIIALVVLGVVMSSPTGRQTSERV
jgi:hypothetical protein